MRILGIDLALRRTGVALVAHRDSMFTVEVACAIKTPGRRSGEDRCAWQLRRAIHLAHGMIEVVRRTSPDEVWYEYPDAPRGTFASSPGGRGREFAAMRGLGVAEGVLLTAWLMLPSRPPLRSIPAAEMRQAVTGNRNAKKERVAGMVKVITGYATLDTDVSDAIAIAIAGHLRRT